MVYVIRPSDRATFKRCRRAWDLSSPQRHGYQPLTPAAGSTLDVAQAVIDALDVYYFPGMWTWDRSVVRPLVLQGFQRSLEEQHARLARDHPARAPSRAELDALTHRGGAMLEQYFEWTGDADSLEPLQVGGEFDATVPDPDDPEHDLPGPDGEHVRYRGRVDVLALDHDERYWLMHHRLADDGWAAVEDLLIDDDAVTACWAWERCFLDVEIAGTIHNELRTRPLSAEASEVEDASLLTAGQWRLVHQHGDSSRFRRTAIPRSRSEIGAAGMRLAQEAADMVDPSLRVYPAPRPETCAACEFRAPCVAMNDGSDVAAVLRAGYRQRDGEDRTAGRLGRRGWMTGRGAAPPSFGRRDDEPAGGEPWEGGS